jgi:hypothetical protein
MIFGIVHQSLQELWIHMFSFHISLIRAIIFLSKNPCCLGSMQKGKSESMETQNQHYSADEEGWHTSSCLDMSLLFNTVYVWYPTVLLVTPFLLKSP